MKPVLEIFGAMLIHSSFQEEMEANPEATLNGKGYTLNPDEMLVMMKIVKSFQDGDLDDATNNVRAICPDWPCNNGNLSA